MKNKKSIYILLIFLVAMLTISAVSASDDATSDVVSVDEDEGIILEETQNGNDLNNVNEMENLDETPNEESLNEVPSEENSDENPKVTLTASDDNSQLSDTPLNFTALKELIENGGDEIVLNHDYEIDADNEKYRDGITIDHKVRINGAGHSINALFKGRIFHVTNSSVIFENIVFLKGWTDETNGGAILGDCTILNCTFEQNRGEYGGAICGGTAINCTFKSNSANTGGAIYEANAINCTFEKNYASPGGGGAIYNGSAINCIFDGNRGYNRVRNLYYGFAVNCTFVGGEFNAEAHIFDRLYFNVGNFTSQFGSGETLKIRLMGANSNEVADAPGPACIVTVYKGEEMIESFRITSGQDWKVNLPVGNYTALIKLAYLDDIPAVVSNISITQGSPIIDVGNITLNYQSEATLTAIFKTHDGTPIKNASLIVDIAGNKTVYTTDGEGKIYIHLKGFEVGTYTANISYEGDENLIATSINSTITVRKAPLEIVCENQYEVEYNSSEKIVITLNNKDNHAPVSDLVVSVDINGRESSFTTNSEGKIEIPINTLAARNYELKLSCDGTESYESVNRTINLNVKKQSSHLSAENVTTFFNSHENLIINLKNNQGNPIENEEITIDLFGGFAETDANGQVTVPLNLLAAGSYIATIRFGGNENYTASEHVVNLTINKDITHLIVENVTTVENVSKDFVITLRDSLNRTIPNAKIMVELFDFDEMTTNDDGQVIISTQGMPVNKYTVFVLFEETKNYIGTRTIGTIDIQNVPKIIPVLHVAGSNVQLGDTSTAAVLVADSNYNPANGTVLVTVDWNGGIAKDIVELDFEGKGVAKFSIPVPGNFTIVAKYLGNDIYAPVVNDTEKVNITDISDISFNAEINEDLTEILITDAKNDDTGEAISGTISGVIVNGLEYIDLENSTVINGQGTIKTPELVSGNYEALLILQTRNNEFAYNTVEFTVRSKDTILTVSSLDVNYGEEGEIKFTLTDEEGTPINGSIIASIAGTNRTVNVTDGQGSLPIRGYNAGNYVVIANYEGNENYTSSMSTGKLNIAKLGTQILYEDMNTKAVSPADPKTGAWFTWTLKDSMGKPMANIPMQIGFNGVIYDEKNGIVTDENGNAKLQINLGYKGTYTFAICYLGDDNHNASFVVAKITVDTQTPTLAVPNKSYKAAAKTKALTATFKTDKGTVVAGKKVSFTVNGKTYSAKTNANGVATVNVSITAKGSYKVTAKFAGDSTYAAITKTATLKIS